MKVEVRDRRRVRLRVRCRVWDRARLRRRHRCRLRSGFGSGFASGHLPPAVRAEELPGDRLKLCQERSASPPLRADSAPLVSLQGTSLG